MSVPRARRKFSVMILLVESRTVSWVAASIRPVTTRKRGVMKVNVFWPMTADSVRTKLIPEGLPGWPKVVV